MNERAKEPANEQVNKRAIECINEQNHKRTRKQKNETKRASKWTENCNKLDKGLCEWRKKMNW